jgi:hypothetical protein
MTVDAGVRDEPQARPSAGQMIAPPVAPKWVTVIAASVWLATLLMGLGVLWVGFGTDFLSETLVPASASAPGASDVGIIRLTMIALCAITIGYASVGALLVGRHGAGRIGAILLAGGALLGLIPFAYMVGGFLSLEYPSSTLFQLVLLTGPVAVGPGCAAVLPLLAIAFPDGRLPSARWRVPVAVFVTALGLAALVQLVRPDTFLTAPFNPINPLAIDALPAEVGKLAEIAAPGGVIVLTVMGIVAVGVRYRRGTAVERQQARWFVAAVALAALPLVLSFVPIFGGPLTLLVASVGLILVPVAVGIAVTRYRLYEIDRLISRTLVYVPLTAIVAGLYAGVVALLQRVFQSVTGDTSDAAIVISTLILASVFTPLRKWLEGMVDRRFKTTTPTIAALGPDLAAAGAEWEARVAAVALRVVRAELEERPVRGTGKRTIVRKEVHR